MKSVEELPGDFNGWQASSLSLQEEREYFALAPIAAGAKRTKREAEEEGKRRGNKGSINWVETSTPVKKHGNNNVDHEKRQSNIC